MSAPDRHSWVIFLAQLPAAPSSARVALWRRLRGIGAGSLLNGAWILPASDEHIAFFRQLAATVSGHSGQVAVFQAESIDDGDAAVIERFRSDRAREYDEFAQRCNAFLAEIAKEIKLEKFTFAELEEIEHEYQKLSNWLINIKSRDFFRLESQSMADNTLRCCEAARENFAETVYAREGVGET